MVADLMLGSNEKSEEPAGCEAEFGFPIGCLKNWIKEDEKMSADIWGGKPAR
jgi:hypothetical protein